jgi:hypothetical protein
VDVRAALIADGQAAFFSYPHRFSTAEASPMVLPMMTPEQRTSALAKVKPARPAVPSWRR